MAKKKKFAYEIHNERPSRVPPMKSRQIPASHGLLEQVRDELKSEISTVRTELTALRFEMKRWGEFFKQKLHDGAILTETQEGRNRYVLDGYTQIFERQKSLDRRIKVLEKDLKVYRGAVRDKKKS